MPAFRDAEDVQAFERRSDRYENSLSQRLFFGHIHRLALDAVPTGFSPGAILDIGCGTGRLLRAAARRWPQAHLLGVDPAEGMVAQARHLTPGADFQVSLAETLSLPGGSIDLA
ncbi:MAG TPA: methyltransferase domain-containing protein, partial [Anaerolineaceae bacterium]|nr:methyltransferase domain-containing protein [Anaerolineaceae bacterium]